MHRDNRFQTRLLRRADVRLFFRGGRNIAIRRVGGELAFQTQRVDRFGQARRDTDDALHVHGYRHVPPGLIRDRANCRLFRRRCRVRFGAAGVAGFAGSGEFCWRIEAAPKAVRGTPNPIVVHAAISAAASITRAVLLHAKNFLPRNKKASRIERGISPHSFSRRVSASTSSGRFPDFQLIARRAHDRSALKRQPITVAGPWPIFTAFPEN